MASDMLKNPRLLWYWSASGGRLCDDYDALTIDYFTDHVESEKQIKTLWDPDGPYGKS